MFGASTLSLNIYIFLFIPDVFRLLRSLPISPVVIFIFPAQIPCNNHGYQHNLQLFLYFSTLRNNEIVFRIADSLIERLTIIFLFNYWSSTYLSRFYVLKIVRFIKFCIKLCILAYITAVTSDISFFRLH